MIKITHLFEGHDWNGCTCRKCGKVRKEGHVIGTDKDNGLKICSICRGVKCSHCGEVNPVRIEEKYIYEDNWGPTSDPHFKTISYYCTGCGDLIYSDTVPVDYRSLPL